MKKGNWLMLCLLVLTTLGYAQKEIQVDDIYKGAFRTKGLRELSGMKLTNQYTMLNSDAASRSTTIDLYDFATQSKVSTLLNTSEFKALSDLSAYQFSPNEKQLLLCTTYQSVYRHSIRGTYFLYDIASKELVQVGEEMQEPIFSPDGTRIAYGKGNNLYVYDIAKKSHQAITNDGKVNAIINGISDWVYEEEFSRVRMFDWSADSQYLAFVRFDETAVPEFTMNVFAQQLYPANMTFKYPKAGETNATVSLHTYQVTTATSRQIDLGKTGDFYIPRVQFSAKGHVLTAQVLNRHQNQLDFFFIDAATGEKQLVLQETNKAYVEIQDHVTFMEDNSFIWNSEKDGYAHLYYYNAKGKLINQITKGPWEVTNYYGYSAKNKSIYYQSTEKASTERHVYEIGLNGKKKRLLTPANGTNQALFSPDYSYFIQTFSSSKSAPHYTLHRTASTEAVKVLQDNAALEQKLKAYGLSDKEFFTVTTPAGHTLNAWMLKPANFDPNKKYPLFMYQYSGPGSQEVKNAWNSTNDYWFHKLTQMGYVVACVDGRGTGYKGEAFKKCTYKELGKYEVEDQIAAAKIFGNYAYIDESRIGIFGWSYGGFMSSNCLFQGNDVFKMAIAVAPVTNWRFYDTVYTERYMQTPEENMSGYMNNSPITHASKLKGNFLLVHGTADDNVHVQNAYELVEALVQANKPFDWAMYPDKDHGIYGGYTRIHLFNKLTEYVKEKL